MPEIYKDGPNLIKLTTDAFIWMGVGRRMRLLRELGFGPGDVGQPKTLVVGPKPEDFLVVSDPVDHHTGNGGPVDPGSARNN